VQPAQVEEKTRIPADISIDSDKDDEDLFAGLIIFLIFLYNNYAQNINKLILNF
jgi:hypothetical protein